MKKISIVVIGVVFLGACLYVANSLWAQEASIMKKWFGKPEPMEKAELVDKVEQLYMDSYCYGSKGDLDGCIDFWKKKRDELEKLVDQEEQKCHERCRKCSQSSHYACMVCPIRLVSSVCGLIYPYCDRYQPGVTDSEAERKKSEEEESSCIKYKNKMKMDCVQSIIEDMKDLNTSIREYAGYCLGY